MKIERGVGGVNIENENEKEGVGVGVGGGTFIGYRGSCQ